MVSVGGSVEGSWPQSQAEARIQPGFEYKSVTCMPMDLERVARAEAVDGWSLVDTTVDESGSGDIRANFRRPLRSAPSNARSVSGPQPMEVGPRGNTEPIRRARAEGAPRPSFGPEPSAARAARVRLAGLFVTLLVVLLLADKLGAAGLILALVFLPGLLRAFLGDGRRRRRRR
jgi:hypothetical protein